MRRNSGTMLLFAIGLIAIISVMAFGFLRSMTLQRNAGYATTITTLARESALMGSAQALEQISRDFSQNAVTTIDGPARAPFRAHYRPFLLDDGNNEVADARVRDLHDLGSENLLHEPAWSEGWELGYTKLRPSTTMLDGRARWIEPNLHADLSAAVTVNAGGNSIELPTAPVRFGDSDGEDGDGAGTSGWVDGEFDDVKVYANRAAPGSDGSVDVRSTLLSAASGSRCAPLLYDKEFRRITYTSRTDALAARKNARYRLRYAAQVRDLDGYFLVNPDPAIDWTKILTPDARDSAYAADPANARIVRYSHAVQNLAMVMTRFGGEIGKDDRTYSQSHDTLGQRLKHLFIGRGWASNYARKSDADPWPRTFPYMYRFVGEERFWFFRSAQWPVISEGRVERPNPMPFIATDLFQAPGGPTGLPAGFEPMAAPSSPGRMQPWRSAQTGAQFSPLVASRAVSGGSYSGDMPDGRDARATAFNVSVFGNGLHGEGTGRYGGAVDSPWSINVLTAPPQFVSALVLGYLPPGVLQMHYVLRTTITPPTDPGSIDYWGSLRGINDLFVKTHSQAFDRYAPPSRIAPAISPDYNLASVLTTEPGYRFPQDRYPGPLCFNGVDPETNTITHDTYGSYVDISEQDAYATWAEDPHIGQGNRAGCFAGALWWGADSGTAVDPPNDAGLAGDDTRPLHEWDRSGRDYADKAIRPHDDSFWSDITYAFNEAVSLARVAKMRYEGETYNPRLNNVYQADSSLVCNDIAALDRLFMRCLGIDPDTPASSPPADQAWRHGNKSVGPWERFTPNNNIFTLKAVLPNKAVRIYTPPATAGSTNHDCDGELQTQVLELMVNDFRYSLFGTTPSYSLAFRPLDFNGDGAVAFSGYLPGRFAAATQDTLRQTMRIDQDAAPNEWASDGDGDGELSLAEFEADGIHPFCQSGSLWIGRSRFWNVLVRGQVYDNLMKRPIGEANLETWLTVDPAQEAEAGNPKKMYSTHVFWQHWNFNFYQGLMLRSN